MPQTGILAVLIHSQKSAPGGFCNCVGVEGVDRSERREIVFVIVGGRPLVKHLLGNLVLAEAALAAEAFDLKAGHCFGDLLLGRPFATRFLRGLDAGLVGGKREIRPVRFPVRRFLVTVHVILDEGLLQRRGLRVVEIQRVMSEDDAFRREFLLELVDLPSGRRQHQLDAFEQPCRMALLHEHRQIGKQHRREDQIGLGGVERRDMRGQVHGADLRPLLGDELRLDAVARQNLLEGFPIVAAVGIVGIDPGHPLELALEILDRQQRAHHRFAFIVGGAENVFRIRHHLLDAVLGGAVPHHGQRLLLLGDRCHAETDAGRDQAVDGIDLLLQDQASKPFDRILRVGLFLDHQLELAPGDAALLVHPLGGPLHRANAALAGGTGSARARRDDSDPERLVLRNGRRKQPWGSGSQDGGPRKSRKIAARELHRSLPSTLRICRALLAYHKYISNIAASGFLRQPRKRALKVR